MTTKRDIYNEGFDRGHSVASWTDLPEIGSELPLDVDWVGYGEITEDNQADAWETLCFAAEENGRQFSPFEMTAHDLNELEETKPYDVWDVFENGITAGIRAYGRQHHHHKGS